MRQSDPAIDEVREVRHRISARFDHDPTRLVAFYMEMQKQYRDRASEIGKNAGRSGKPAAQPIAPADAAAAARLSLIVGHLRNMPWPPPFTENEDFGSFSSLGRSRGNMFTLSPRKPRPCSGWSQKLNSRGIMDCPVAN